VLWKTENKALPLMALFCQWTSSR